MGKKFTFVHSGAGALANFKQINSKASKSYNLNILQQNPTPEDS